MFLALKFHTHEWGTRREGSGDRNAREERKNHIAISNKTRFYPNFRSTMLRISIIFPGPPCFEHY